MGLLRKLLAKQKDDLIVKGVVPGEPSDVWPVLLDFQSWPLWFQDARGRGLRTLEVLEEKPDIGTRLRMEFTGDRAGEFRLNYKVEPSVFSLELVRSSETPRLATEDRASRGFGGLETLIFDFALKHHPQGTEIWWRPMWTYPKETALPLLSRWPAKTLRRWIAGGLVRFAAYAQTPQAKAIVDSYYRKNPTRDRTPLHPSRAKP